MLEITRGNKLQIRSNVITAVVTALSVVALTWNPAADAVAPEATSISVCVNKKSGAMRNASKCSKSERKIEMAQANVKLTVPAPILADQIPANLQLVSTRVATEVPLAELAGQSVQTVVSHITVPNFYGRDSDYEIDFPSCPASAPIRISFAPYSTNYEMIGNQELWNQDGSIATSFDLAYGKALFSNDISLSAEYPKDGDIDLYLVTLCAPNLVVQ
jgi:hypothetical protein